MDFIIILFFIGLLALLFSDMFPPTREPEYVLVPIQRQQESFGCLPTVVIALLFLLMLILLFSNGQH
jgi:hypothetical protein